MEAREFLGCSPDGGTCRFELGDPVMSVWGGVHGGALAAAALLTARHHADGRTPVSLDVRFLRNFLPGTAMGAATVLRAGRVQTTVEVQLSDAAGTTSVAAIATFVNPDAVAGPGAKTTLVEPTRTTVPAPRDDDMRMAGIVRSLDIGDTFVGDDGWAWTPMAVPWSPLADTGPEMACLAADLSQGSIAWQEVRGEWATPNVDLAIRFTAVDPGPRADAYARTVSRQDGFLSAATSVWSEGRLLASSLSTCVLLAGGAALPGQ